MSTTAHLLRRFVVRPVHRSLHFVVRSTVGVLVAREWFRSAQHWRTTVRNRRLERDEVARHGSRRISADVVTIVPTYRRPELLRAAVLSALAQDIPDHAVVVISDGDPVTAELPADPRLHVIELSRNFGVAGIVRNVGIRCSTSRYIAFLDDDNEWMPGHLAALVTALDDGAHLAYTGLVRVLADGTEHDRLSEPFVRRELRERNYIDVNTMAIRRTGHVLFSRRLRRALEVPGEDWVYVWRQTRRRRIAYVPECSVRYLINPGSYFWPGFAEVATARVLRRNGGAPAPDEHATAAEATSSIESRSSGS